MPTVVQSAGDSAAFVSGATDVAGASDSDAGRGRMRRVASAPAFKHASCYHELSPTAAVAAAVAASCPASSSGTKQSHAAPLPNVPPCSSCNGRGCNCLEVYVVSRSFSEFAGPVMKRLHPDAREHLVTMGICHYMTVFKTPDGRLVQFDFGPLGGDVQKAHGPLATFLRRARAASQQHQQQQEQQQQDRTTATQASSSSSSSSSSSVIAAPASSVVGDIAGSSGRGMVHSPSAPSLPMASLDLARDGGEAAAVLMQLEAASNGGRPKRGVAGEIRERSLQQLPSACMYMGRTSLSLEDIRQYNAAQGRQTYTLHENDCRHYVNSLVQYTTGVERSTQHLKRHYFHSRHADKWLWYGWFISASQLVTDVGNWSHIQAGAAVTLLAVTGRSTLASLKTLATPMLPALKGLPALLPSAGFTAAAAATAGAGMAAPGAAAAAAAAGGGSGATVIGTLATTLKLPATLLLRRPLAAGAAAGSAGAAAAALRDTSDAAVATTATTTGSSRRQHWRPLHSLGDGMAHGLRSAMLGLRRLALGNTRALQQLQQQPLVVQEPAAATASRPRSGRGFWGGSNRATDSSGAQQQPARGWFKRRGNSSNQLQLVGQPGTSSMLAAPAAMAAAGAPPGWQQEQEQDQQQQQQVGGQPLRRRPFAQFTQHVGRHVVWLGSSAARASSQLVLLALGGSRVAQHASAHPAAAGDASRVLVHSASSHQLQQQVLAPSGLNAGHRSLSMPSLLTAGQDVSRASAVAAAAAGSSTGGSAGGSVACAAGGDGLGLCGSDMAFMWDSGSSSIICSSIGSKPSGVGRQVLTLPAPRISWVKRASQAMLTRQ